MIQCIFQDAKQFCFGDEAPERNVHVPLLIIFATLMSSAFTWQARLAGAREPLASAQGSEVIPQSH
jgi:hypothetical protein